MRVRLCRIPVCSFVTIPTNRVLCTRPGKQPVFNDKDEFVGWFCKVHVKRWIKSNGVDIYTPKKSFQK